MTYNNIRRAIIQSGPLVNALAQLILYIAVIVAMIKGATETFWSCAALLALLKLENIADNIERTINSERKMYDPH